jgi:hypothetical protein
MTQLPFRQLSAQAMQADTFQDFPTSLMSVGNTADNGTVSVFTKDGVNVFKEEDVLITCKGEPILISIRDSHGRYPIPLMQQLGQWQPRRPSKQARKALRQANSVLQSPINRTSHQMDARRLWLPSKINVAQSHQSRPLCGLANAK